MCKKHLFLLFLYCAPVMVLAQTTSMEYLSSKEVYIVFDTIYDVGGSEGYYEPVCMDTLYIFPADEGYYVHLEFLLWELDTPGDGMMIYDGSFDKLLGTYTSGFPDAISTTNPSEALILVFFSDETDGADGFMILATEKEEPAAAELKVVSFHGVPQSYDLIPGYDLDFTRVFVSESNVLIDRIDLAYYLSLDEELDESDDLIGEYSFENQTFNPGEDFLFERALHMDKSLNAPSYYLIEQATFFSSVKEIELELLNSWHMETLFPDVDLQPEINELPVKLFETGKEYLIGYQVLNSGSTNSLNTTTGIYLSQDMNMDENDTRIASFTLPEIPPGSYYTTGEYIENLYPGQLSSGQYYLLLKADDDELMEETSKNNNVAISQVYYQASYSGGGNITFSEMTLPDSLFSGNVLYSKLKISSDFSLPVLNFNMYLSSDDILDINEDGLIFTGRITDISAGENLKVIATYLAREDLADYEDHTNFVFIVLDEKNNIPESTKEDNTLFESFYLSGSSTIDVVPGSCRLLNNSLLPGQRIDVSFNIKNAGTGIAGSATAGFLLSDDTIPDEEDILLYKDFVYTKAYYSDDLDYRYFNIADCEAGDYYILLVADYLENITEYNEDNNVLALPLHILDSEGITGNDLELLTMTVEDTLYGLSSGQLLCDFIFKSAVDRPLNFYGYLSEDSILDDIETFQPLFGGPILPSANMLYRYPFPFTMNDVSESKEYYIIVKGSIFDSVSDDDPENNLVHQKVFVYSSDEVSDLRISDFKIDQKLINSGSRLSGSFAVYDYSITSNDTLIVRYYITQPDQEFSPDDLLCTDTIIRMSPYFYDGQFSFTIPESFDPGLFQVVLNVSQSDDKIEKNPESNTRRAELVILDGSVDFDVQIIKGQSSSIDNMSVISVEYDLINLGNILSSEPTVAFYMSADEFRSPEDTWLGSETIPYHMVQTHLSMHQDFLLEDGIPSESYFLLVSVDPDSLINESNEENNNSSLQVADFIQQGFNYKINDFSADILEFGIYDTITLYCEIENSGNIAGNSALVEYYLSNDTIIDNDDKFLAQFITGTLLPETAIGRSITLILANPPEPGKYYLLCCIDRSEYQSELNEEDNIKYIEVNVLPPDYDFSFGAATGSDTIYIIQGSELFRECEVVNNGASFFSGGLNIDVYLSTDDLFDPLVDNNIFNKKYPADFLPGQSIMYPYNLIADATLPCGTYYCIIVLDINQEIDEMNEENNTWYFPIEVTEPDIDLSIQNMVLDANSVFQGEEILLTYDMLNTGQSSTLEVFSNGIYFSEDSVFDEGDLFVRPTGFTPLAGLSSYHNSEWLNIPPDLVSGTYYLMIIADYNNAIQETNEENNIAVIPLTIVSGNFLLPDIVITGSAVSRTNTQFGVSWTLKNASSVPIDKLTKGRIRYSKDWFLDANDPVASDFVIGPIEGWGHVNMATRVNDPGPDYHCLFIEIDYLNELIEMNEGNNQLRHLLYSDVGGLDLAVTIDKDSLNVNAGASVNLNPNVSNVGSIGWENATLRYYISVDSTIDESDLLLVEEQIGSLDTGEEKDLEHSLFIPEVVEEGQYILILGLNLDSIWAESNFYNNFEYLNLEVELNMFDLDIQASYDTIEVFTSEVLEILSEISNLGPVVTGSLSLEYYLSVDTVVSNTDLLLERIDLSPLEGGISIEHSDHIAIPSDLKSGEFELLLYVYQTDPETEVRKENNTSSIHLIVTNLNGIGDRMDGEERIYVYPNPAKEFVWVRSPVEIETYKILNPEGKCLAIQKAPGSTFGIEVNELTPGTYILLLESVSGRIVARFSVIE